jgi:hypothetical protein
MLNRGERSLIIVGNRAYSVASSVFVRNVFIRLVAYLSGLLIQVDL